MSNRKAPCHCGSGKKYKNCHNSIDRSEEDARETGRLKLERQALIEKRNRILNNPADPNHMVIVNHHREDMRRSMVLHSMLSMGMLGRRLGCLIVQVLMVPATSILIRAANYTSQVQVINPGWQKPFF